MWNPLIWILLFGFVSTQQAVPNKGKAAIDSYGKLIQAKNSSDGKKIAQTDDGIQFEVPNYASGIVVPKPYNDLLPPLTSSEKLEDGSDDSDIVYIGNFGGTSNNIRDGKSIGSYQKDYTSEPITSTNFPIKGRTSVTVEESIEVPYTDLNPPHFVENTERNNIPLYDGNVYKGGFGGPSGILGKQESVGTYHQEKNVAADVNSGLIDLISPPLSDETVKKTEKYDSNDSNVYKGGFGGSSGILGNQKSIGTYHQQKNIATDVNPGSTDSIPPPLSDETVKKNEKYNSNVYKGGFGGPSGILGNQESIGTYHQQKNIAKINTELTDLKPPLSDPGTTKKVAKNTDDLLYDGDIYKGGFGGSSGILGTQELVGTYHQMKSNIESDTLTPILISDNNPTSVTNFIRPFSSSTENSVYNGDIYNGGFGGPAGLLGEQKVQGTFHQSQDNEKQNNIKEIINENKTENIKVIQQLQTTIRPSKKIVSRFEFSSIQKPNSNINRKKDDVKKHTAKTDPISSSTINSPSIDLLPPIEKHDSDKSTDKFVSENHGGLGSGIRKPVANYYETEEPENGDMSTTPINDIQITQSEEITTESPIDIGSKEKIQEFKVPINLKNEAITPPSVDLIPPLVDSITIQETTTADTTTEQNNEIMEKQLRGFFIKNITKPDDTYKAEEHIEHNNPLTDSNLASVTTKSSVYDETDKSTEKSLYEDDIYKGGFGGSDGVLGEQKSLGTYHQGKAQEIATTTIAYKDTTFYSPNEEINTQDLTTILPTSTFNDRAGQTTENSLYEGDIYKGGFGGPQGFLSVQQSSESHHQKKNQEITDTTIAYKDTIHQSQNEESNTEGFTTSSNIKHDDEADKITEKSLYDGDIYKGKFGGSAGFLGDQKLLGTYHQENPQHNVNKVNITVATVAHQDVTLNSQNQETSTQDFTIPSNIKHDDEADKITEQSLYEGDIYKGGFGGSAGYLGEQKSLGTFHQVRKQENVNVPKINATTIAYNDTTYHSKNDASNSQDFTTSSNIPNLISNIPSVRVSLNVNDPSAVNTKSFLSSPITAPTLSLHSTTPEPPSIYFTPPFFSPKPEQEQTLLIEKGIVPSYSPFSEQPPLVLDQRFNSNQKIDYVNDFVFAENSNNFSPPQQQSNIVPNTFIDPRPQNNQKVFTSPVITGSRIDNPNESAIPVNTINNLEKVVVTPITNSFGNIQGFNPQFLSSIPTNSNNKFTGNFGGAAGILGNQKQPGYGVQPQSHIEPDIATIIVSNNKYNGGFGGPPGILSPFDNNVNIP